MKLNGTNKFSVGLLKNIGVYLLKDMSIPTAYMRSEPQDGLLTLILIIVDIQIHLTSLRLLFRSTSDMLQSHKDRAPARELSCSVVTNRPKKDPLMFVDYRSRC